MAVGVRLPFTPDLPSFPPEHKQPRNSCRPQRIRTSSRRKGATKARKARSKREERATNVTTPYFDPSLSFSVSSVLSVAEQPSSAFASPSRFRAFAGPSPLRTTSAQKKKASAVAGKLPLCFVAFVWSQGPKRNVVTLSYRFEDTRTSAFGATRPARDQLPLGSLLRRLLGRLLGRLLSGLLCHGACHLLSLINLVIKKIYVNDFSISSHPFSRASHRPRARHAAEDDRPPRRHQRQGKSISSRQARALSLRSLLGALRALAVSLRL